MPRKATSTRTNPATAPQRQRRTATGKDIAQGITSESIAADLAEFRRQGGKIEVMGNSPLRPHISTFRSKATVQAAAPAKKTARG